MQLLKEEIKKRTSSNLENTCEASFARRVNPQIIIPPALVNLEDQES